ncbi:MAG TPA: hypothetical protein PKI61_00560 [bacterium]|nr:hypothetical protein [bacterium]HPT29379.1 hypothetical protein [bacterium]
MKKDDVYKILGIKKSDSVKDVKSKLGLFRLNWMKDNSRFSEKEMDKIGDIVCDIIDNDIEDSRTYAEKIEDAGKDLELKALINSLEKEI